MILKWHESSYTLCQRIVCILEESVPLLEKNNFIFPSSLKLFLIVSYIEFCENKKCIWASGTAFENMSMDFLFSLRCNEGIKDDDVIYTLTELGV